MRVFRAGLAAGVVLVLGGFGFDLVLARLFPDLVASIREQFGTGPRGLVAVVLVRLAIGWVLAWLYAAARFRLRSTARTAFKIGRAAWFLLYVPMTAILYTIELIPAAALVAVLVWGLIETLLAAFAAGYVHQATRPDDARY